MAVMGQWLDLILEVLSNRNGSMILCVGMVVMGQRLDLMILEVFSNPNGSRIL